MSELKDSYWIGMKTHETQPGSLIGPYPAITDKETGGSVEYRRIPSLPDVMEDGYVVMERDGICLVLQITDDEVFYEIKGKCIPYDVLNFMNLPDLSNYHVQDGKIVRNQND